MYTLLIKSSALICTNKIMIFNRCILLFTVLSVVVL